MVRTFLARYRVCMGGLLWNLRTKEEKASQSGKSLTKEFVATIGDEDVKEADWVENGDAWTVHEDRE